jgi:hypothetical protein
MKHFFTSILFFCFILSGNAQDILTKLKNTQRHKGFYLSMALGPSYSSVNVKSDDYETVKYTGIGGLFDFKLGGNVGENLLLHASLISNGMVGPEVSYGDESYNSSSDLAISHGLLGIGLTNYSSSNTLVSGSVGMGRFSYEYEDENSVSDWGFGAQFKVGKEWWVSRQMGLGVALSFNYLGVKNKPYGDYEERINSYNYGVVFNVTLN